MPHPQDPLAQDSVAPSKAATPAGTSSLHGLIPLRKPPGMISKDLSRRLISLLKQSGIQKGRIRIGHVGSLDPLAEGVLPVVLGRATRLQDYLLNSRKVYDLTMELGYETDTLDSSGTVLRRAGLPYLSRDTIEAALKGKEGKIQQVPPLYSAVKYRGKPLYFYARSGGGIRVPLKSLTRSVHIHHLILQKIIYEKRGTQTHKQQNKEDHDRRAHAAQLHSACSALKLRVICSRGTYIRVLCQDLAYSLGTLGTMSALLRLETAGITLEQCCTLEELLCCPQSISSRLLPLESMPVDLPRLTLTDQQLRWLYQGKTLVYSPEDLQHNGQLLQALRYSTHRDQQWLEDAAQNAEEHEKNHSDHELVLLITDGQGSVVSLGTMRLSPLQNAGDREVLQQHITAQSRIEHLALQRGCTLTHKRALR